MELSALGKYIFFAGLFVAFAGALIWALGRIGLPFGGLPGDVRVERDAFSFYFPVVTCIILSVALTVILNIIIRLFRK